MKSYVVFDTETTGLDLEKSDIIELSAARIVDRKIDDVFTSLIQTSQVIPSEAYAINHISKELLDKEGLPASDVFGAFRTFIGDSVLIAHNGLCFDFPMLLFAFRRCGLPIPPCPLLDTVILASTYLKTETGRFHLKDLCAAYHIVNPEAHRALSDTLALREVVDVLLARQSCFETLWRDCYAFDLQQLSQAPRGIGDIFAAIRYGHQLCVELTDGDQQLIRPLRMLMDAAGDRWVVGEAEKERLRLDQIAAVVEVLRPQRDK
jgi:DNA polymerase III epsilon subunit-like protein